MQNDYAAWNAAHECGVIPRVAFGASIQRLYLSPRTSGVRVSDAGDRKDPEELERLR